MPWCGSLASLKTTGCSTRTPDGVSRCSPGSTGSSCGRRWSSRPGPGRCCGLRGGQAEAAGQQVVVDAWPHLDGVDLLGDRLSVPEHWRIMGAEEYEAVRIAAGVPKMGAELTEKTIPAETGLIDQTVSFTKGCYTGQELVARIDSRGGHVPRHLRGLLPAAPIEAGAELVDSAGRTAGTVTSAAPAPSGDWVGLGYVRRGVDIRARLWAGPGGPEVDVRELPL